MNRYSWLAVGIIMLIGFGVFGMLWMLPQAEQYAGQEKRITANGTVTIDAP